MLLLQLLSTSRHASQIKMAKTYVAFEVSSFTLGSVTYRLHLLHQLPSASNHLFLEPGKTSIVLRSQTLTHGCQ